MSENDLSDEASRAYALQEAGESGFHVRSAMIHGWQECRRRAEILIAEADDFDQWGYPIHESVRNPENEADDFDQWEKWLIDPAHWDSGVWMEEKK